MLTHSPPPPPPPRDGSNINSSSPSDVCLACSSSTCEHAAAPPSRPPHADEEVDDMDAAADVLGAADASARTLSRLHALISAWAGAPEQVHHLRDDVERFSSLLESTRQAGGPVSAAAGAAAAARPVDDDPVLVREVALARRALEAVEAVLADLLSGEAKGGAGGSASGSSAEAARSADAKRRHRWVLRREEVARSQRGLQLSCQQMLSRLVMLNL